MKRPSQVVPLIISQPALFFLHIGKTRSPPTSSCVQINTPSARQTMKIQRELEAVEGSREDRLKKDD